MVDTRALRALAAIAVWRFESSPWHITLRDKLRSVAQLVERRVWDAEVQSSNLCTPTMTNYSQIFIDESGDPLSTAYEVAMDQNSQVSGTRWLVWSSCYPDGASCRWN